VSPRARATLGALTLLMVAGCAASPPPRTPAVDPDLAQMSRLAQVAYEAGSLAQAVVLYERALARARVLDNPVAVGDAAYNLAVCLALRGHDERAWEFLREAEAEFRRAGADLADVWLVEAKVARRRGRPLEARTLAARILTDPGARPTDGHRVLVAVLEGDLACDTGGAAAARSALTTARNRLGTRPDPGLQAEIARLEGRLDLLEARPDRAALAFDEEAGLWQGARRYPEMARALGRAGEAYRVAGRPGPAADRLFRAARSGWAQGERGIAMEQIWSAVSLAEKAGDPGLKARALTLQEEMTRALQSDNE